MGRQLDPDFDMAGEAAPFLEQVLFAHAAPGALVRRGWRTLSSALALIAGLPQDLRQLLRSARRGQLQVQVEVLPLKQFGDRLDRAASRLAISVVTAALIVGSAIVITVERAPGLPSLGLMGFIAAVIGGIWLLISIWRGGKG
jgi:ubiquinone biosynthesis protein